MHTIGKSIVIHERRADTVYVSHRFCTCKRNNIHGPFTIGVLKSYVIVSHISRAISAACYVFLGRAGSTYRLNLKTKGSTEFITPKAVGCSARA